MQTASRFLKDPQAVLDYKFDWAARTNGSGASDWLATSETIATFTVSADAGITIDSSALTDSNTSVTAWLSGGTAENDYIVTCHIVTNQNRTDERSMQIQVRNR